MKLRTGYNGLGPHLPDGAMSVIQTVKSAIGMDSDRPTYECVECGTTFESATDPDSHWFNCPECGSEEPLGDAEE